jgi:hypothetical protein
MAFMNTEASRVIIGTSNASRGQSVLEKCRHIRDLISGRLLALPCHMLGWVLVGQWLGSAGVSCGMLEFAGFRR